MALTHGSLFSGIGGFDLGMERAGFRTVFQVEIDPYCNKVLERHFPQAKRYGDITKLNPAELEWVDVITGGFPCQPHSVAGRRKGEDDHRDLWGECVRMLRGIRPRYAVFENVPGLLVSNGGAFFNRVLTDIHESGYDAEWEIISAADVGAPHLRKRVWIVAYQRQAVDDTEGKRWNVCGDSTNNRTSKGMLNPSHNTGEMLAYAASTRFGKGRRKEGGAIRDEARGAQPERRSDGLAYAPVIPKRKQTDKTNTLTVGRKTRDEFGNGGGAVGDTEGYGCEYTVNAAGEKTAGGQGHGEAIKGDGLRLGNTGGECGGWWAVEPPVGRLVNGLPNRVERLKALGNALVPQVAEWIGRRIMAYEAQR